MAGQTVIDRLTAAKHSIAGHGLAKSICKATTEEVMGPKKKHIDYLLQCTNEPNVSIPQMADLLIERTQNNNWVVVYKSLITIHNLMNYGNERFTQYLASNNCTFNLGNFLDKSGVQAASSLSPGARKDAPLNSCYDMSTYIRRYAKYLNEKAFSYRSMAFDFCKVKRGKNDGTLRTMGGEKLLKALPVLQGQVDALLEFDCTTNELTNGVINACFMLMFKDLIRLFACYNDGVINLLEKFFDMNKKQAREALDLYKKFLVRMERVSEFLKVAENVGIDKGDIPDLARAPSSLLEALEAHLAQLEGNKKGEKKTKQPESVSSAINTLAASTGGTISEEEKKKILEEESQQLQKLKDQAVVDGKLNENNPFSVEMNGGTASLTSPTGGGYDLLGAGSPSAAAPTSSASADLLSLGAPNPFTQTVMGGSSPGSAGLFDSPVTAAPVTGSSPWGTPAPATGSTVPAHNLNSGGGAFASEAQFAAVFGGSTQNTGGAMFNNTAAPPPGSSPYMMPPTSFDALGEVMKPLATSQTAAMQQQQANQKLIQAGNLDGSLSSLASNLNINSHNISRTGRTEHQWKPQGEKKLTGGVQGWNQPGQTGMAPMATAAPQMGMTMMGAPRSPVYPMGGMMNGMNGMSPQMHAVNGMNSWPAGAVGAQPAYGQPMGYQQPMGMQPQMGGQPGMFPQAGMQQQQQQQQPMMNQPRPTQPGGAGATNDPFGAL